MKKEESASDYLKKTQQKALSDRLLAWFEQNARDLPWRHNRTPYRIWIAEVMLQQTQVDTVIPYYARFLDRFPTLQSLASAPLDDVLKVWEGLGYYARARNLHASARQVIAEHNGRLPETYDALLDLPGLGPYAAGAIASIAFGQPVVALDGNVRRVLARFFIVGGNPKRAAFKHRVRELAEVLLSPESPGQFNEALIELGATVCTPKSPRCDHCPWQKECQAHDLGVEEAFPQPAPRRKAPHYEVTAAVLWDEKGQVLVAQRRADDFLGGLWEFPGGKQEDGESLKACLAREIAEELDITVEVGERLLQLNHAYTHFRITLHAFHCQLVSGTIRCLECADARWVSPDELETLPMSVADRQIAKAVQRYSKESR